MTLKIIEQGKKAFEETAAFKAEKAAIKQELASKYAARSSGKTSLFRRLVLHLQMAVETRERLRKISSRKNLHLLNK